MTNWVENVILKLAPGSLICSTQGQGFPLWAKAAYAAKHVCDAGYGPLLILDEPTIEKVSNGHSVFDIIHVKVLSNDGRPLYVGLVEEGVSYLRFL
jgi:hypothetical protein